MNASELRELSIEELATKGDELRTELVTARLSKATGQLEDTARLRTLGRTIARVETILSEKSKAEGGANQ